jgi:hypothetical protein
MLSRLIVFYSSKQGIKHHTQAQSFPGMNLGIEGMEPMKNAILHHEQGDSIQGRPPKRAAR